MKSLRVLQNKSSSLMLLDTERGSWSII